MLLQECLNYANFVVKRPGKAQFPGCLMNVVKMLDGRRKMEDVATPINRDDKGQVRVIAVVKMLDGRRKMEDVATPIL